MLKFHEFLKEQNDVLDVDSRHVTENAEAINADLDALTEKPYQNAPIFLNQLRGTLERFGILLPASATPYFLNLSAEVIYSLGTSGLHLYCTYDTNDDGFVDGYAQIVDSAELNDLTNMDLEDILDPEDRDPIMMRKHLPARRDDDAGNSDEY